MEEANAVLQEYLPRFNNRFAVAAEQPETAYRPVPEDLSLTETVSIRHTRKVARDNTVKYHWRVLQLLPGEERPSYAGLRVDVLERADGELMIRYQGEAVDFQEAAQPTAALWGEGTGLLPSADKRETASGLASSHLDEDQQKLLADLDSSVEKRAKARKATGKGRGGKEKRCATGCTAHLLPPSRPVGRRCSRRKARDSPCGLSPGNWAWQRTPSGNTLKPTVRHQTAQRQRTGQGRGPGRSPDRRRLTMVTFSLFN